MHLPKVAGKYVNSPFFKMAANAIIESKKEWYLLNQIGQMGI